MPSDFPSFRSWVHTHAINNPKSSSASFLRLAGGIDAIPETDDRDECMQILATRLREQGYYFGDSRRDELWSHGQQLWWSYSTLKSIALDPECFDRASKDTKVELTEDEKRDRFWGFLAYAYLVFIPAVFTLWGCYREFQMTPAEYQEHILRLETEDSHSAQDPYSMDYLPR